MKLCRRKSNNKTVTLVISASKLTGRIFKSAVAKFMRHLQEQKMNKIRDGSVKPVGKQTVKELIGQNQGVTNIEISGRNIGDFDRVARKYGVDYAVKKDKSGEKPKYLVFFKARDTDALTAAFAEYTAKTLKNKERPSVVKQLRNTRESVPEIKPDKIRVKNKGIDR